MLYVEGEENNVFGIYLGNIISVISHMVLIQKYPELTIIGGNINIFQANSTIKSSD